MFDNLTRRLSGVFAGLRRKGRLSEADVDEALREVRVSLLEADVSFAVAKQFMASLKQRAVGEDLFGSLNAEQTFFKLVKDEMQALLGEEVPFRWASSPPTVVLLAGLQGSGKTTTAAKLARWLTKQGKSVVMAACDLQRPAAIEQLKTLGAQIDVPVIGPDPGDTPVKVAQKALENARHYFKDVLIVDTAGRLSIDEPLMTELANVSQAVRPSEVFLVLDATIGQEAVNVAQAFHERVPVTGTVFTKLDGDTRGGAVLSVRQSIGVPVRFIGTGEQTESLETFVPERMVQRIIGMGDVMGIIERAEVAMEGEDMAGMQDKMKTGKMDFSDLLQQFRMLRKMGPIKNVMKLVPGLAGNLPPEALDQIDERRVDRLEAIVLSMTPYERTNPDILNGSRRRRIAKGSGTSQEEVNRLIEQLYQMRKGMKQFAKMDRKMRKFKRR